MIVKHGDALPIEKIIKGEEELSAEKEKSEKMKEVEEQKKKDELRLKGQMYYIYYYKNKNNGKMYVGQTEDLKKRHNHHKYSNALLIDKAIKKYGIDNFIFKTIEMCLTQEEANEREIFWIDFFHSHVSLKMGYNRSWGGNSCLDDDTRKKIGDKVRGPLNYNYGKSVRNDIRKKMSESMSGVKNPKAKLNLEL